jgi:hypothetical protein
MMNRWRAFLSFFVLFLSVLSFSITHSLSKAEAAPVSVPSGTIATDFVFGAGQTYLVTGPTVMTGVVTIEGSAVIKYDDAVTGASLDIANPVFQTTPSNFAVFTSKHDNTAGEVISGSTGSPGVSQYANALILGASEARFVQIRHADVGIQFQGGGDFILRDSEFFAVGKPLNALSNTSAASLTMNNVLVAFSDNGPTIMDDGINPLTVTANNLTFYTLSGNGFDTTFTSAGSTFSVTDSVFVDIQGADVFKGSAPGVEDFNAFFQTPQNGTGTNDLALTSDPLLTDFFIDQTSSLINAGSKTATDAGLFHYTTNVDQSIEANTTVDMGYHIPPDIISFSILATNSIWLKKNSMSTGNIGVNDATPGPWVNTQAQLVVGKNVVIPAEISLFADSIKIKNNAIVNGSVFTNQLTNNGTINGPTINPLALPLSDLLPIFRSSVIGGSASDIEVANGQELVLVPGEYGDITVKKDANLRFTGGVYHIRSIFVKKNSSLSFDAISEIRIEQSLRTKRAVFVGPNAGSNLNADDIQFFIEGFDDGSTPRTAKFGQSNTVNAHFYVPNGTIWLKKDTVASGAFFGKNVIVGQNTDVSEESGTSNPEVAAPIITPNGGSFFDLVSVSMSTITTGASIFYTLDGTTPTSASTLFIGPFNLANDAQVNAIATRNGFIDSAETTADFIVQPMPQVDPVAFDPAPDTFQTSVDVSLSTTTVGATIHYTLDGTTPTTSSPVFTTAITLTDTTTINAFAVNQDFIDSAVATGVYVRQPTTPVDSVVFDPAPGTFLDSVDVSLSTTTPGATIHFTVDGSTPTTASPVYTGPITLNNTRIINAFAVKLGFIDSSVESAGYVVEPDPLAPPQNPSIEFGSFDFIEEKGRPEHEAFFPISGQPVSGTNHEVLARLLGPVDTVVFRLVSLTGETLQAMNLSPPPNPPPGETKYYGSAQVPNEPFKAAVSGLDTSGIPYDITFQKVFNAQTVEVNFIPPVNFIPGATTLPGDVTNHGSADTFSVIATDNNGFVTRVTPSLLTLSTGQTGQFEFDVSVPSGTPEDTRINLTLLVTSTSNPLVSNFAIEKTLVLIPPTVTVPADITVASTGTLTLVDIGTATATDNFGIDSIVNDAPAEGFPIGTTVVTWTATDTGGNQSFATQNITITPP